METEMETDPPLSIAVTDTRQSLGGRHGAQHRDPEEKTCEQRTETPKGRRERRREEGSSLGGWAKTQRRGQTPERRGQRSRGEGQGTQRGQGPRQREIETRREEETETSHPSANSPLLPHRRMEVP